MRPLTASSAVAWLHCPAVAVLPHAATTAPAAQEGNAAHRFLERVGHWREMLPNMRLGQTDPLRDAPSDEILAGAQRMALDEVPEEHRDRCAALDLAALEPFLRPGAWIREQGLAYDPVTSTARRCPGRPYTDVDWEREIAGTGDALSLAGRTALVADFKLHGEGWSPDNDETRTLEQLRVLGLMWWRLLEQEGHQVDECVLYAVHLDSFGRVRPVETKMSRDDMEAMAARVAAAWDRGRALVRRGLAQDRDEMFAAAYASWREDMTPSEIITATLNAVTSAAVPPDTSPGDFSRCVYCPARLSCPAITATPSAALGRVLDGRAVTTLTAEEMGQAYVEAGRVKAWAERVQEVARLCAKGAPLPLPDGKELAPGYAEKMDGAVTAAVLRELLGTDASAQAVTLEVTGEALKDVVTKRVDGRDEQVAMLERIKAEVARRGGLSRSVRVAPRPARKAST